MTSLTVYVFKDSFGPFLALLNEHNIKYRLCETRAGVPMASGGALELVQVIGSAAFWPSVATVVVAFIKGRRGRKVIVTTKDGTVVHAEGLSPAELERVLERAASLAAIDPNRDEGKSEAS